MGFWLEMEDGKVVKREVWVMSKNWQEGRFDEFIRNKQELSCESII